MTPSRRRLLTIVVPALVMLAALAIANGVVARSSRAELARVRPAPAAPEAPTGSITAEYLQLVSQVEGRFALGGPTQAQLLIDDAALVSPRDAQPLVASLEPAVARIAADPSLGWAPNPDLLVRVLCARVVVAADQGQGDRALEAWRLVLRALRDVTHVPSPETYASRVRGEAHALAALAFTLDRCEPTDDACRLTQEALDAFLLTDEHVRALRFEQRRLATLCDGLRAGDPDLLGLLGENAATYRFLLRPCPWLLDRDEVSAHELFDVALAIVAAPGREPLDDALDLAREQYEGRSDLYYLTKTYGPARPLERVLVLHRAIETRRALARTALALRRHRLRHGSYPSTLGELDAPPLDPWSGELLRYARTDAGAKVWSVGRNGRDEGGPPGDWLARPVADVEGALAPDDEGVLLGR